MGEGLIFVVHTLFAVCVKIQTSKATPSPLPAQLVRWRPAPPLRPPPPPPPPAPTCDPPLSEGGGGRSAVGGVGGANCRVEGSSYREKHACLPTPNPQPPVPRPPRPPPVRSR
jgi:hypothetical protein